MKHLIALSMKYIRRQKLRTFLTFMCITLSAFILSSVCAYCSSIFRTLMNEEITDEGLWEVDISSWIENCDDKEKAFKAVENNAVVDDYFASRSNSAELESTQGISYFEIAADDKKIKAESVRSFKGEGNTKLVNGEYIDFAGKEDIKYDVNTDGVYISSFFSDMGYSKGDTVTLTIRPVMASYDESSEIMKEVRAELKEKYGTEYTTNDAEYEELPEDLKKKAYSSKLYSYLQIKKGVALNDIPVTDEIYGEPVEYTVKIAGFYNDLLSRSNSAFTIVNTNNTNIDLHEIEEKNPDLYVQKINEMKIRIIDNCNYDDAMKRLFTDLGFDYDTQFFDSVNFPYDEHDLLLALEWKSPSSISKFMAAVIIPGLIILLVAWFVARFVIDNAFEMAVQERSTHFAALRVMGASKTQIAFLVFAEALFYCFTAVPLGTAISLLLCRSSFNSIKGTGLPMAEFHASLPIISIGIALCLIAILISAFTSAMWASRKLSPAEALNFGKPRSKKRKFKKSKSKLNLSANKFLHRYTRKNIRASKSRFVVATITMGLGVLMFTVTVLTGTYTRRTLEENFDPDYADLWIDGYYCDDIDHPNALADKYFSNNEIFSKYLMKSYSLDINPDKKSTEIIKDKLTKVPQPTLGVYAINKGSYDHYELDKITGMSYEEFKNCGGVIYNNCNYERDHELEKKVESFPSSYKKLTEKTELKYDDKVFNIVGISSSHANQGVIIPIEDSAGLDPLYEIQLRVSDQAHYEEAEKLFNEFSEKSIYDFKINMYTLGTGLNEFINAIIKIAIGFFVSIWLVGILSMINCVNTSVLNRSRELMMLRSVGMTRKQLRKSVMLETILFSSTAAITGTALGVGGFLATFLIMDKIPSDVWGLVTLVVIMSIILNIIIALVSAIPAIKNLGKVEAIAQAANG